MMPLRMLGLLMLMLLQCDAHNSCPDDGLTVTTSEAIAAFGSTIFLNCSKEDDDHYGIFWMNGETILGEEKEEAFLVYNLTLSDWNIRPQCKLVLNESFTCTKDPELTVYKNPEFVNVFPLSYEHYLVEGTQFRLQCDIDEVAPVQNLTVTWYKDNEIIRKAYFTSNITTPMSESDILTVNISTKDDGAQFKCEAQLDFGPDGAEPPFSSDPYTVSVHYPPVLNGSSAHDIYKEEGDNVTLICDAEGRPSPNFLWIHNGVNMTENAKSLFVNPVNEDTVYTCTAANPLGRITKEFHVHVIKTATPTPAEVPAMPEKSSPAGCPLTLTPAELVVKLGDPASVNCSTSVADPARLGWEAPVSGSGFEGVTSVTWNPVKVQFWKIAPMCYITTRDNEQCDVSLAMTVYKTPEIITDFPHGVVVKEGEESVLKCDFINVAPVQNLTVRWYRGHESIKTERFDGEYKQPVNTSSNYTLVHKRGDNGEKFSCSAELHLGPNGPNPVLTVTSEPYVAAVNYEPHVKSCPNNFTGVEHNFMEDVLHCEADGNPPPKVQWFHQGELVNLSQPLTRSHSGRYKVEFSNNLGNDSAYVDITVEYGPSFTCDGHYKVQEYDHFQINCEPEGNPAPTITWFKDGKAVYQQVWTKRDSGKYEVKANNKHGTAIHEVEVDVMYEPQVKSCPPGFTGVEYSFTVSMISCEADGNPPPKAQWFHQGKLVNLSQPLTRSHSGRYKVEFSNNIGKTSYYVDITVEYGPSFTCGNHYEVQENDHFQLSCKPEGNPAPTVTWFKDEIKVKRQRWMKDDGGKYKVIAKNEYGTASHNVEVDVMYAPEFKDTSSGQEEVTLGGNVTLRCSAEGNPAPMIRWDYNHAENVNKTTRGSYEIVSITGATSVNAGVYICVATNKIGKVSSNVTLTVTNVSAQKRKHFPWWWWLLIVLAIFIFISLCWCYFKRQKKHGKYDFIRDKSKDDIPMTSKTAA